MTPEFAYVVCSIEESKDIDMLSIDELQSSLLVHEQPLRVTFGDSSGNRGRSRGGFRGRGRGGGRRSFDKSTVECYNCHRLGHFQYECPLKATTTRANYAEGNDEINHMCGKKEFFSSFDDDFREIVKLGDGSSMNIIGKGNVRILINGVVHIITNVFHVPGLKNNLISIGQLAEKGLAILIQQGTCKVYHPDKGLILEVNMSSNRCLS
ncbi:hypothetical protein K2173_020014 [Erythroxylum novogranatense]|uniref:CCHC-type domain-containing protein n=1 Tax=Erythroxylum novogranatense TaxID=1862640 RepID=A0AAV8U9L0_9ROSI|nr:hypothetical protein K2173_020014 [Erythroxylum novogranatense]